MANRFYYVQEKDQYFDESTGRLISYATLTRKLSSPEYTMPFAEQARFVRDLKDSPVTLDKIAARTNKKKKVSKGALTDSLYEFIGFELPVYYVSNSGVVKYVIANEHKEAVPVSEDTPEGVVSSLIEHVPEAYKRVCGLFQDSEQQEELQLSLKEFFAKMLERVVMDPQRRIGNEIPKISWDGKQVATKQFFSNTMKPGPTPNWDSFVLRLDYPEIFKAWVYSIVQPHNAIRQALIMVGAGNDGKSSVAAAICKFLGDGLHTSMSPGDESSRFFLSKVHGKVLLNYDDCKNMFILSSPVVKSITGGAQNAVEYKGKNSFNAYIKAHMLITTNLNPIINPTDESEISRLLLLRVQPLPKNFQRDWRYNENLLQEFPNFLYSCKQSYEKLISEKATEIKLTEEQRSVMVKTCTDVAFVHLQEFISNRVHFTDEGSVPVTDFIREINAFWSEVGQSKNASKYNKLYMNNYLLSNGVKQENVGKGKKAMYLGMELLPEVKSES